MGIMNIRAYRVSYIVVCACLFEFAFPVESANAQGITLLRLGWVYAIGFPEDVKGSLVPTSGAVPGVQTYRIMAYGGEQWYRVQLVARQEGGGWYVPQGVGDVWVNLNYALWVHDAIR